MNTRDWGKYIKEKTTELDSRVVEADNILASIQAKLDESETNRKLGADTLANINLSYQQVIKLINDTNTDLAQIGALRTTALDPTTGIDAILNKITSVSEKAEKAADKISLLNQDSSKNNDEIKNNLTLSKKSKDGISRLEVEAQDLLNKLQTTYQVAINTGLAGSFDERRKQIERGFVNKWSKRFIVSLSSLGVIAVIILIITFWVNGFGVSSIVFFRLSLLTPLIFYTGYSAVQYSRERSLLEKYAFKSVVAASLESYTELLKIQFGTDYDKNVIGFVLNSMTTIYGEPHEVVKKRALTLGVRGNKFAEFQAAVTEDIQEMKELIDKRLPES